MKKFSNNMKKALLIATALLGLTFVSRSQTTQICQPDSATVYFDMSTNPQWYYENYLYDIIQKYLIIFVNFY